MKTNISLLASLIQDTRKFIEQQMPPTAQKTSPSYGVKKENQKTPAQSSKRLPQSEPLPQNSRAPKPEFDFETLENQKGSSQSATFESSNVLSDCQVVQNRTQVQPPPSLKTELYGWELHPMIGVESPASFRDTLAKYLPTCDAHLPVRLLLPEENPEQRLFLDNVAKAITRTYLPASVMQTSKLPCEAHITHLFAPVSILRKKFSRVQSHHVFLIEKCVVVPMEELVMYTRDLTLKRSLWSTIQQMFHAHDKRHP